MVGDPAGVSRRGLGQTGHAGGGQRDHHAASIGIGIGPTNQAGTDQSGDPAGHARPGRAYAAFAADIDNGTHTVPDFTDAVRRHEVIAAIERSAATGERVNA
jgi:predicted dehydrogenase